MAGNLKDIGDVADELKSSSKVKKTVRIILEENENIPPSGQFIGYNGKGYLMKPGEEVEVPETIIEILNHAVQSKPITDPQTRQVIGYRDGLRFPYRVIRA